MVSTSCCSLGEGPCRGAVPASPDDPSPTGPPRPFSAALSIHEPESPRTAVRSQGPTRTCLNPSPLVQLRPTGRGPWTNPHGTAAACRPFIGEPGASAAIRPPSRSRRGGATSPSSVHSQLANLQRKVSCTRILTKPMAIQIAHPAVDGLSFPSSAGSPPRSSPGPDHVGNTHVPMCSSTASTTSRSGNGDSMIDAGILDGDPWSSAARTPRRPVTSSPVLPVPARG